MEGYICDQCKRPLSHDYPFGSQHDEEATFCSEFCLETFEAEWQEKHEDDDWLEYDENDVSHRKTNNTMIAANCKLKGSGYYVEVLYGEEVGNLHLMIGGRAIDGWPVLEHTNVEVLLAEILLSATEDSIKHEAKGRAAEAVTV